jgi:hypothetical protein
MQRLKDGTKAYPPRRPLYSPLTPFLPPAAVGGAAAARGAPAGLYAEAKRR